MLIHLAAAISIWLIQPAENAPPASSAQARARNTASRADAGFQAVVVPRHSILLSAPRDGVLVNVAVEVGQRVSAGDVIAVLDSATLQLDLAAAKAALRETEAERFKAAIAQESAREFHGRVMEGREAFTETERRDAYFRLRLADQELVVLEARIERNKLDIARAEDLLRRSTVASPASGVISARLLDAGATVTPLTPIVRIISADDLLVRFGAPVEALARVRRGATVMFRPSDHAGAFEATVENVTPDVDPDLRQVIVEAALRPVAPAAALVRPGMEGRAVMAPTGPP